MFKDFKEFALKGNMVDMAVGIIIGAAFGKIISSLVSDVIMPPIGLLLGKMDFSNLFITLSGDHFATIAEAKKAGVPTLNIGLFLNNVIDFVIVAFAVFMMVRLLHKLKVKQSMDPVTATKDCPHCLSKIPNAAVKCAFCTSQVS